MGGIFLVAGEPSGDLHGSALVQALKEENPRAEIFAIGGARMAGAGAEILYPSDRLSVVGLVEVAGALPAIFGAWRTATAALRRRRPDVFVPIDYPGFNLRLAAFAARRGVPVVYYIAPQLWAWRRGRIKRMRKSVRRILAILPFEEEFFRSAGIAADFVGHPLLERPINNRPDRTLFLQSIGLSLDLPVVALLPGSRPQEIRRHLPLMRRAMELILKERKAQSVIAALSSIADDVYAGDPTTVRVVDRTAALLSVADVALVASGTATLEAALAGTPMVIVYRVAWPTYWAARSVVTVPYIGLINLIAGKGIVPELLQNEATPEAIAKEALRLFLTTQRDEMKREMGAAVARLAGNAGASRRAARLILSEIE